ncbi:hypothetical protein DTL42_20340 [Bremerella cremea]|uniref:Dodecin domain-containing protein n=1 Tax=Bremerella cremea TaxID=1031537 RepID=A0A368KLT3_9BACT|nr:hypothetical protein [Bremerella cremea]RCS42181.1 hypothetical protein DTL42_20340 [Bremerella cremea]
MSASQEKKNQNHFEHSDIIRIIGHSHKSFDDAVEMAIKQLTSPQPGHDHHPNRKLVAFKIVEMGGALEHDPQQKNCDIIHFSVTMDIEARHVHSS